MKYILVVLMYYGPATAEFNTLQDCNLAAAHIQEASVKLMGGGVRTHTLCVSKGAASEVVERR